MDDFVFTSLHNEEHMPLGGRVTWVSDRTTRVRLMLYPVAMPDAPQRTKWTPGPPTGTEVAAEHEGRRVRVADKPLSLILERSGKPLFEAAVETFSRKKRLVTLRIHAGPETRFYGLGGQFLGVEHSGREIECQSVDVWGEKILRQPEWASTYYPVPFLWTTDGYALFFDVSVPITFTFPERGGAGPGSYTVAVASPALDVHVIEAADPQEALREYARLQGRPYVPPKWALEPLMGHASNHAGKCFDRRVLDLYLRQMRENRLPNGIIFDETWSWASPERDETGATRLWFHPEKLGDFRVHNFEPEDAGVEIIHAAGQRSVLHISPFIGIESEYAAELLEKGYLVMRASDPTLPLVGEYNHYYLDFTHPEAVAWWQEGIRRLLRLGVDGFFADFGEADDQRDALYHRGTGESHGQLYCVLGRKAVFDMCREERGDDFFLISRAGWSGMQRYAGALLGDQPGTFDGMRWALSAMQSLAMSAQGVAAHNLGGYAGQQEKAVYLRWVQLGVVSPMFVMWNSGPTGEPWTFDAETVAHYRASADLRMRLLPYLHSALKEYGETGMPLIRPMALLYPRDAALAAREDQFLCGSELLVAPIFSESGERTVSLPPGDWVDFWSGERLRGGKEITVKHGLETFPLFVRQGGVVPMESSAQNRSVAGREELEIHLYGTGENRYPFHDGQAACEVQTLRSGDGGLVVQFVGALQRPGIVLCGHAIPTPTEATFTDTAGGKHPLPVREADAAVWQVRLPGGGGSLTFRLAAAP